MGKGASNMIKIVCRASFYSSSEGGRDRPISGKRIHCLCRIGEKYYDCAIDNPDNYILSPGQEYRIGIEFVYPERVVSLISVGLVMYLCEVKKDIAKLVVEEIESNHAGGQIL